MMKKSFFAILAAAMMLISVIGCSDEQSGVQIDPNPDTENAQEEYAVLYFGDPTGNYLVPEFRVIDVPANQSFEEYIIKALVGGPSEEFGGKLSLINPGCTVKSVKLGGDVLTITLDKSFLDWSFLGAKSDEELARLKNLAVTSMVNSLVEATGYSRVQILVDMSGNGVGSRVLASEVGLSADKEQVLGPMGWIGDSVLDAESTMRVLLAAMQRNDTDMAYSIIASTDVERTSKLSSSAFEEVLEECPDIESFSIEGYSPNPENKHCCVIVSYTMRTSDGTVISRSSVPAELARENDVWKMKYEEFVSLFVEAAEG